jgi:hypothetical protein
MKPVSQATCLLIFFFLLISGIVVPTAHSQGRNGDKISGLVTAHKQIKERPPGRAIADHKKLLRNLGVNADNLASEDCALYCVERLTVPEIAALAAQGIRVNPDVWIPPVPGKHPTGFHLASVEPPPSHADR